jgi:hypothetical protein
VTTERTLAELRLRHAQLTARAETLRDRSKTMDPTTRALSAVLRDVRQTEIRALEYAALIRMAEGAT